MIGKISIWAKGIVIAVIIVSIIEMILPNGSSKKYIKMVIGFYILYVIINPIIKLLTDVNINNLEIKDINSTNVSNVNQIDVEDYNNEYIENIYKSNLKVSLKKEIENMGYTIKNIDTKISMEDENYGEIKSIEIGLLKEKKVVKEDKIKIEKVEIGDNETGEKVEVSDEEINNLKKKISQEYGVDIENIKCSVVN